MQFSGAFWATLQRFQMNTHAIDSLLSKDETTLEDVLNDDTVIQEMRSQNQKLIEFLTPERLHSLLELITVFPEDPENKKRCHNHPFVACELLSESGPIHDKISENDDLLHTFFSILSTDSPHSTLLGYFSKAALALISRNPEKLILYLSQKELFPKLLNFLYSRAIVDILIRILTIDIGYNSEIVSVQKEVMKSVVLTLGSGSELQVLNAEAVICELLNRVPDIPLWKELVQVLIEADVGMKAVFETLKSVDDFRVAAAAAVIKGVYGLCVKVNLYSHLPELDINSQLKDHLEYLKERLKTQPGTSSLNTMKVEYRPLGEARLRIVELISSILKQDNESLYEKIAESNILRTVTHLFFEYPWHSILHSVFDNIVQTALLTQNPHVVESLLANPELLANILSVCKSPNTRHRFGHLGYIHKLSNNLKNTNILAVQEFLVDKDEWKEFVNGYLTERNLADLKQLGEMKQNEPSSSSDEPEISLPGLHERIHKYTGNEGKVEKAELEEEPKEGDVDEPDNVEDNSPTDVNKMTLAELEPEDKVEDDQKIEEPRIEEPKIEVQKIEEQKIEERKIEEQTIEEPKIEVTKLVEEKIQELIIEDDLKMESEVLKAPLELSPLNKRRSSGSQSPKSCTTFGEVNFWKIEVLVDELDGLELE